MQGGVYRVMTLFGLTAVQQDALFSKGGTGDLKKLGNFPKLMGLMNGDCNISLPPVPGTCVHPGPRLGDR